MYMCHTFNLKKKKTIFFLSTGLDLYVVSKNGKISSQVVGLAPVAGMCTTTSSCTINEGKHFESVFVVAHEIGHK